MQKNRKTHKIRLNRETLRRLDAGELGLARGGTEPSTMCSVGISGYCGCTREDCGVRDPSQFCL